LSKTTPMHRCQLGIVAVRRGAPAPLLRTCGGRQLLYIVTPSARTATVSPMRGTCGGEPLGSIGTRDEGCSWRSPEVNPRHCTRALKLCLEVRSITDPIADPQYRTQTPVGCEIWQAGYPDRAFLITPEGPRVDNVAFQLNALAQRVYPCSLTVRLAHSARDPKRRARSTRHQCR